jgi:hypothetical protein
MVDSTDVTKVTFDVKESNERSWAYHESVSICKRAFKTTTGRLTAVKWSLLVADAGSHLTAPPACGAERTLSG